MQLSNSPKTSDRYGRYYTDQRVAALLVESMATDNPGLVLDLGAGDGALVGEASRRWSLARFVTVDIDAEAASSKLGYGLPETFDHHVLDALDDTLAEKIGLQHGSVDSALCNPPYLRPKWRAHFGEILEDAGLSGVIPKLGGIPSEILFIAQNLRFLRDAGKLGLILPDGVIAGEKFAKLRHTLAIDHRLERVIELPRRVFRDTDAKAHIVILSKHTSPADSICVQRLEETGKLSEGISVHSERARERLDYSYLSAMRRSAGSRRAGVQLREITTLIKRGSYSSAQIRACEFPVFHTTDFSSELKEVPRYFQLSKSLAAHVVGLVALPGDILIARVGRNLEEKVCTVIRGAVLVSDCILVLRVAEEYRARVLKFFQSESGRTSLVAASHGVGAKFVTSDALLNMII